MVFKAKKKQLLLRNSQRNNHDEKSGHSTVRPGVHRVMLTLKNGEENSDKSVKEMGKKP